MSGANSCFQQKRLTAGALKKAAGTLKLLAHPQRLRIIEILEQETEAPVYALIKKTGFPQAVVSQHLNQMRRKHLLTATRQGKEMWYSITDPRVFSILNCICTHCSTEDFEK